MEVENNFLDIPEHDTLFNIDIKFLYVRQSYLGLHKLIFSKDHANRNVIITGTPGVGKSMFALYELYLALREGKTVVFRHLVSGNTYIFDIKKNRAFTTTAPYAVESYLEEEGTVYLYDAGTKSQPQYGYFSFSGRILVFSSPERKNYADIHKKGAMMCYMPTWSWSEISHIVKKAERDEAVAQQMFDVFGGVPRYVFIDTEVCRTQFKQMLDNLCAKVITPDFLLSVGQESTKESHRLLYFIVHDENYTEAKLDFASRYVQKKVFETLTKRQKDNVLRFLEASSENTSLAILRGRMFESHCHELLSQQAALKARKLAKKCATQPASYIEKFDVREKTYFKSNAELGDSDNSQRYMVPSARNYASVDAIIPGCSQAFQMTVSTSHPVNAKGIISVMDSCSLQSLKLFFVVPNDIFPNFYQQPYEGNISNRQIEQYALCVDIPSM